MIPQKPTFSVTAGCYGSFKQQGGKKWCGGQGGGELGGGLEGLSPPGLQSYLS